MGHGCYRTPPDLGPAAVYHDVLIAYDEARRLNNGQPSLWAFILEKLQIVSGERALHLGCGMGYYSAILVELVGPRGEVVAIEIDPPLSEKARVALAPWPHVEVVLGDGSRDDFANFDVIVVSAGTTHPLPSWLGGLNPNDRLILAITVSGHVRGMLLATRRDAERFDARFLCRVAFYEFAGARDAGVDDGLKQAFARDRGAGVRSIRTDSHADDESCWLHGEGWCPSRRENEVR